MSTRNLEGDSSPSVGRLQQQPEYSSISDRSSPFSGREIYFSLFDVLTPLLKEWRLLSLGPLFTAGLVFLAASFVPKRYTAIASFTSDIGTPQLGGGLGGLAGLAGQFGVASLGRTSSGAFFAFVLESRELLEAVVLSEFATPGDVGRSSLLNLLAAADDSERARVQEAIKKLRRRVSVSVDRRTDVVTLGVTLEDPELAASVANRMMELLNDFNLQKRRSQSREQRRFAAERVIVSERELRNAESAYQRFLVSNRSYRDSPTLVFEAGRLEREVELRQEVFLTLSRKLEEARIAEVQDTPVITVIDRAVAPHEKSFPQRTLMAIGTAALVGLMAIAFVVARTVLERAKASDPVAYSRFTDEWSHVRRRLTRVRR